MESCNESSSNVTEVSPVGASMFSFDNMSSTQLSWSYLQLRRGITAYFVLFSLFLNIIIIMAVCCSRRLRTVSHVFIASLAVSNLITSGVVGVSEFIIATEFMSDHNSSLTVSFKCTRAFLIHFSIISNHSNHFFISTERWFYIAHPFLHERVVTPRSTVWGVVFVWLFSGAANLNLLIDHCGRTSLAATINTGVVTPILHFLLSLVMFSVYSHIAYIVRCKILVINKIRSLGTTNQDQGANLTRTSVASAWNNVRMLVTVFGTFFICMTPGVLTDIYAYCTDINFYDTATGHTIDIIWYSHCCWNFFIYSAQDRVFRNVIKDAVQKVCYVLCRRQRHSSVRPRDQMSEGR